MKTQKMPKSMTGHGLSQFEITQKIVNNLQQFDVTPTAKLVLIYLSTCYNPKKADIFPKQKTIAIKLGISERSVVRAVQELFKAGLILVECKYSNRYKLGSKIVSEASENDKNFYDDKVSEDLSKKGVQHNDNLSVHEREQKTEKKKEPINVDDFKILKGYAERMNARNIKAYIDALKANGSADRIIKQEKEKQAIESYHAKRVEDTQNWIKQNTSLTGVNPKECAKLQEVLKAMRA